MTAFAAERPSATAVACQLPGCVTDHDLDPAGETLCLGPTHRVGTRHDDEIVAVFGAQFTHAGGASAPTVSLGIVRNGQGMTDPAELTLAQAADLAVELFRLIDQAGRSGQNAEEPGGMAG